MKRIAASLLAMALTVAPLSVNPLGLGQVDLRSHLNEPLDARIPLLSLRGVDTDSIRVTLGTPAQFERAGIERPFILTSLSLALKANGSKTHIQVSSREPIGEPFLNFLVEIDWPNGRTLREYTLLLDPPVYGAAITNLVKETVPTVSTPPTISSAITQARQPRATSGRTSQATFSSGGTYGPVKSSDTLWSLADRFRRGSGVSIQQMMLAMLRYNPDGFLEGNVNLLREGAVLTIPTEAQAEELARTEALREVQRQHAAWRGARQMTSATPASAATPATLRGSAPKGPMADAPPAKSSASDALGIEESRLKLVSRGDASGGVSATSESTADVSALRSELDQARDEADASRREAEELSARVEETEAIIQELERLAKIRDADLAALQKSISSAGARAPANDASSAPMMTDSPPTEAKTEAGPATTATAVPSGAPRIKKTVPLPPPSKPSAGILDKVRNALSGIVPFDPLLLVGGGILAIVIAVVGIVFSRRRKDEAQDVAVVADYDVTELAFNDDISPDAAATVVDMPSDLNVDAMETLGEGPTSEELVVEQQESTQGRQPGEDPLAEVNVYLAYERFEQAEGLVKDAIEKNPDRSDYKLKLLEIYHAAKNVAAFQGAALVLQEAVGDDHEIMATARQWWQDLSPSTELFSGDLDQNMQTQLGLASGGDDVFDVTAAEGGPLTPREASQTTTQLPGGVNTSQGVDFDPGLDFESSAEAATGVGTDLDFDLGFDEEPVGSASGLDLDLSTGDISVTNGDTNKGMSGAVVGVTAGAVAGAAAIGESGSEPDETLASDALEGGLDFDLGGFDDPTSVDDVAAQIPERGIVLPVDESMDFPSADLGDTDLDFSLGDGDYGSLDIDVPAEDDLDFVLDDPLQETPQMPGSLDAVAENEPGFDVGADTRLDFLLEDDDGTNTSPYLTDAPIAPSDVISLASDDTGTATDINLDLDVDTLAETSERYSVIEQVAARSDDFDLEILGSQSNLGDDDGGLDFDFDSFGDASGQSTDDVFEGLGTVGMAALGSGGSGLGLELPRGDDSEVDFDLDFSLADDDSSTEEAVQELGEASGFDLDFDLGGIQDTATLDSNELPQLSIDEDFAGLFGSEDATESPHSDASGIGLDEGGLDFDFASLEDEPAELPISGTLGTPSEDPDLDLDSLLVVDDTDTGDNAAIADDVTSLNLDELELDIRDQALDSVLDFDLGSFSDDDGSARASDSTLDFDFDTLEDDDGALVEPIDDEHEPLDYGVVPQDRTLASGRGAHGAVDEIQTKLDLAQAYMDMGDQDGAKGILGEVMAEGDPAQKGKAEELLKGLV